MTQASSTDIPNHLGIVLDGNRRWAKERDLPTLEGHRQGSEVFKALSLGLFRKGIRYVSAYVFSVENWSRTNEEVGYLMKLVTKAAETYLDDFNRAGIRIVALGSRDGLSATVLKAIDKAEKKTEKNTAGTLALCFNYGGHDEIIQATKQLIQQNIEADDITKEVFESALYHPEIPPVDLLLRTSGEQRISGFMLYRAAYAELLFVDKYWPDMTMKDMETALATYAERNRRFGN